MHNPILINNLSLSFPNNDCFEDFTIQIYNGNKIGILGRNGVGKTSLLQILQGLQLPTSGNIILPKNLKFGYLAQIVHEEHKMSGGEYFINSLNDIINAKPDVLILDEPTNHLDVNNRHKLFNLIYSFPNTIILATHDVELLRKLNILWHIHNNKINIFTGQFDDYINSINQIKKSIENEVSLLSREKHNTHEKLMREQSRASNSKKKGEKSIDQRKWPTVVSKAKANKASHTAGTKKKAIKEKKEILSNKLQDLWIPPTIIPKFSLTSKEIHKGSILSISSGTINYINGPVIIEDINLSIYAGNRVAIKGNNQSGKSTFIRAILRDSNLNVTGEWQLPKIADIGYVEQLYNCFFTDKTVFESIKELVPSWKDYEIRKHLNDFLFRSNNEINNTVSNLSGGEKARLKLAQIAAKTPSILILDEITNNIDLETRNHIINVLKHYLGTLIIISHDEDFLKNIAIDEIYKIEHGIIEQQF